MENIYMFIGILVVTVVFTGCYKHIPKEAAAPADVKEVALDITAPKEFQGGVDVFRNIF